MFNMIIETSRPHDIDWLLEIFKIGLPGILGFVGALLGLWIWHSRKRSEPKYESVAYFNRKQLDGLMKAFSLLAFLTEVENPKSVMLWEKQGDKITYYLRPKQAREYIIALGEMFYADGYGLLLGKNVKELFYEYRSLLYGVLLSAKRLQNGEDSIKLENENLVKRMKEIYGQINSELRKEREKIEH